jgi:hypothetical protein
VRAVDSHISNSGRCGAPEVRGWSKVQMWATRRVLRLPPLALRSLRMTMVGGWSGIGFPLMRQRTPHEWGTRPKGAAQFPKCFERLNALSSGLERATTINTTMHSMALIDKSPHIFISLTADMNLKNKNA